MGKAARRVWHCTWRAAQTRRRAERKAAPPVAERVVRVCPPMMGDIGEEITEIELEPLPEAPAEEPTEAPVEPATEPVPG